VGKNRKPWLAATMASPLQSPPVQQPALPGPSHKPTARKAGRQAVRHVDTYSESRKLRQELPTPPLELVPGKTGQVARRVHAWSHTDTMPCMHNLAPWQQDDTQHEKAMLQWCWQDLGHVISCELGCEGMRSGNEQHTLPQQPHLWA
jgi:hypothetical protein